MKTLIVLLSVFALSLPSMSSEPSASELFREAQVVCDNLEFDENRPRCSSLIHQLADRSSFERAIDVASRACQEFADICSSGYYLAKKHLKNRAADFKVSLEKRCLTDPEFCLVLGEILIEEKQIEKGLQFLQKDYEYNNSFGGGFSYAIALKNHKNDSTLIHKMAWNKCKKDESGCAFLVRNYPGHPKITSAVKVLERRCQNPSNPSYGADECYILGRYYSSKKQPNLAIRYWSKSCTHNDLPCLAILSSRATRKTMAWAFQNFCTYSGMGINLNLESLRKQYCTNRSPAAAVPEKLILESKKILN